MNPKVKGPGDFTKRGSGRYVNDFLWNTNWSEQVWPHCKMSLLYLQKCDPHQPASSGAGGCWRCVAASA